MLLISNGLYKILEPKTNKIFRIWVILIVVIGVICLPITHFHPLVILAIPISILIVLLCLTSGNSQEYELRDRKIYFKKVITFRSGSGGSQLSRSMASNNELEVYYIVSALHAFRFEQTAHEKRNNIGRIYFNGTTKVEADRPLTQYEKSHISLPYSFALYGIENFDRIKETLYDLLPPEKFLQPRTNNDKTE